MSSGQLSGDLAPSILPFVGTGLAIIAYTLTIITYCLFGSLRREASGNVVLSLAAALLLLNISFLAAAVRTRFQDQHLCNAVGVALHFFLLASVMWHVVDALFSYNNVSRPLMTTSTAHSNGGPITLAAAAGNHANANSIMVSTMAQENQVSTSLFIKCALFAWGQSSLSLSLSLSLFPNSSRKDIRCDFRNALDYHHSHHHYKTRQLRHTRYLVSSLPASQLTTKFCKLNISNVF